MNELDRPSLTAVIIAKNEAEMIANCIETLRWCDEIIVLDNDSTDATPELATQLGARVVSHKTSSFAELRDKALKHVKTDWVFYIDADERVTPRLSQEILVHLETGSGVALQMLRQNMNYGTVLQHGGWQNDIVTRVFRREQLTGWTGEVHESPVFSGEVVMLHSPLIHLTHRSTIENLHKTISWTPIEAKLLYEGKQSPVTLTTLIRKMVMEVWRRAIWQGGHKDGLVGWIEALIQGMNRLLVYVQVWELQQQPSLPERYRRQEQEIAALWKKHT